TRSVDPAGRRRARAFVAAADDEPVVVDGEMLVERAVAHVDGASRVRGLRDRFADGFERRVLRAVRGVVADRGDVDAVRIAERAAVGGSDRTARARAHAAFAPAAAVAAQGATGSRAAAASRDAAATGPGAAARAAHHSAAARAPARLRAVR